MPTVEYIKKRSIVSPSIGDPAILEFRVREDTQSDRPKTHELMTMGNAVSSVFENILKSRKIITIPFPYSLSAIAKWREFLHSCAAREPFLYDPTGTEENPGPDIIAVTLVPERWTFNRIESTHMSVSMEFEETAP